MFNKIILMGRLGKDPELRYLPTGTQIAEFSLAVTSKYKDKEETYWASVTVFGKQAESSAKYLKKGSVALVEGRITEQKWETEGKKKSKTVIVANAVKFLSGNKNADSDTTSPEESEVDPF